MMRHAKPEDMGEMLALFQELYSQQPLELEFNDELAYRNGLEFMSDPKKYLFLVVEHEGKLVGGILAYATPALFSKEKSANEVFFYVQPSARKLGYGRKLFEAYLYWAKLVGCSTASAAVPRGFPELEKLYKGFGAEEIETAYLKVLK